MTTKIWKFPLPKPDREMRCVVYPPRGSHPKHVAYQGDTLCVWMHVAPDEPAEEYVFEITGTGWDVPKNATYVGTVTKEDFVWHVWLTWPPIRMQLG